MTDSIPKSTFNAAVQAAISAVKPLLLQVETDAADVATITGPIDAVAALQINLSALHDELSNQLAIADALGSSGGMHTNTGGTGKGNES